MRHLTTPLGRHDAEGSTYLNTGQSRLRIRHPLEAAGLLRGFLARAARLYRNHRAVRHLAMLDDHLLRDIGISRADVEAALSKPAWSDPSEELAANHAMRREAARRRRGAVPPRPANPRYWL